MRVEQTRLRPDPTSTSTHGAEAAQPLLRLFRPHREHKAVSVRLFRPHRGAQGCFGFIAVRNFPSGMPYLSQSVWDCQREISSLHSHHVTSVDMFCS